MYEYFSSGFKGALLVIIAIYILKFQGYIGAPVYMDVYYTVTKEIGPIFDQIMAGLLFALSGGIWGVLFAFISKPKAWKGLLYGLVPTLWLWIVVVPYTGGEFFGGFEQQAILLSLILNCLIWGSYVGYSVSKPR